MLLQEDFSMKASVRITFIFLLSLVLISGMISISASANDNHDPIPFVDETGAPQVCTDYTNIYELSGDQLTKWYVVDRNYEFSGRLEVVSDAKIVLVNGSTLTVKKGIAVNEGATLTIYGQKGSSGHLVANEDQKSKCAGIGGDNNHACGTIIINGGDVTAYGGSDAAGIGGGNEPTSGNVNGVITINGGIVTATGGKYGAGIGGGDLSDGGVITINGGSVTAYGGQEAAAIGGGDGDDSKYGNGGTITINGGKVTAESYEYFYNYEDACLGAGIGGGTEGGSGVITINGGIVSAMGNRGGAGIGSGCDGNEKSNKSLMGNKITITGGEVHGDTQEPWAPNLEWGGGAGIGSGRNSPGCDITISGGTIYATGTQKTSSNEDGGAGIGNSQHSKGGSVTITGGTITAYTSCAKASCIGKGQNGDAPVCTLNYPGCMVSWNNTISSENDRAENAFKSRDKLGSGTITIGPCTHTDLSYEAGEASHTAHCEHCGADIEEAHTWEIRNDGDKHRDVCKICGYEGAFYDHEFDPETGTCECGYKGVRIHFEANGGSGEMADEIIVKGTSYILPECGFTAPEEQQFIGWTVSLYDPDMIQLPGYGIYKPQKPVTITAQWGEASEEESESEEDAEPVTEEAAEEPEAAEEETPAAEPETEQEESVTEGIPEAAEEETEDAAEEPVTEEVSEAAAEEPEAAEEETPAAEPETERAAEPAAEEPAEPATENAAEAPSETGSVFSNAGIAALIAFLVLVIGAGVMFFLKKKKQ